MQRANNVLNRSVWHTVQTGGVSLLYIVAFKSTGCLNQAAGGHL